MPRKKPNLLTPSVTLLRHNCGGRCHGCHQVLPDTPRRYAFAWIHNDMETRTIYTYRACDRCADMDEAIAAARADGRRYTAVGVNPGRGVPSWHDGEEDVDYAVIGGQRCFCGAVSLVNIGNRCVSADNHFAHDAFCIACSKTTRMLDRVSAEAKLVERALKELRREIRQQQARAA